MTLPRSRRSRSRAAAAAADRRLTSAGDCSGGPGGLSALWRALSLGIVILACALAGPTPSALAQPGPVYTATPPTACALYKDGPSGRWLLGGAWLYRADPTDAGLVGGWWRNLAATDGWSPVTVPNSFNAGDFSDASMHGSVGWYRRDFTSPPGPSPHTSRAASAAGSCALSPSTMGPPYGSTAVRSGRTQGPTCRSSSP